MTMDEYFEALKECVPIYRKFYKYWWFGRKRDWTIGYWVESDKAFRKRINKIRNRKNKK